MMCFLLKTLKTENAPVVLCNCIINTKTIVFKHKLFKIFLLKSNNMKEIDIYV